MSRLPQEHTTHSVCVCVCVCVCCELLCLPLSSDCLPRSRSARLLARCCGGERKEAEKWVRATYFFPTVHGGRGWRCYRQLDEEQGLMGRQGLVARRSHSELGQRQRLRLVNGLSSWGEKLQMKQRLFAPS